MFNLFAGGYKTTKLCTNFKCTVIHITALKFVGVQLSLLRIIMRVK